MLDDQMMPPPFAKTCCAGQGNLYDQCYFCRTNFWCLLQQGNRGFPKKKPCRRDDFVIPTSRRQDGFQTAEDACFRGLKLPPCQHRSAQNTMDRLKAAIAARGPTSVGIFRKRPGQPPSTQGTENPVHWVTFHILTGCA